MSAREEMRYEFGKNWHGFVRRNFTQERCEIAKSRILEFSEKDFFQGVRVS